MFLRVLRALPRGAGIGQGVAKGYCNRTGIFIKTFLVSHYVDREVFFVIELLSSVRPLGSFRF